MPTYEYVCEACQHELEIFQSMSEAPKRKCPACGKQRLVRRIGGGAGILFRGSGFYQTDYRSDSYKKSAEKAEKGESKSDGAAAETSSKKDAPKADAKGKGGAGSERV